MKGLRGTAFDPFGRGEDRKLERRLIAEYEALMDVVVVGLTPANHAAAVALAGIPDQIRGYGPVKAESVETAKAKEADILARFVGKRAEAA